MEADGVGPVGSETRILHHDTHTNSFLLFA